MPKLKGMRFTTAIIERYRRRETSVEEAINHVPGRRLDAQDRGRLRRSCGGRSVSAATVSNLNEKAFAAVEELAKPPARSRLPLRLRLWHLPEAQLGRELRERGGDGGDRRQRRRLPRGDSRRRRGLHRVGRVLAGVPLWLKLRGLRGVRMFTGDKAAGMVGSIAEVFPNAAYQRCTVHFYRNAL